MSQLGRSQRHLADIGGLLQRLGSQVVRLSSSRSEEQCFALVDRLLPLLSHMASIVELTIDLTPSTEGASRGASKG